MHADFVPRPVAPDSEKRMSAQHAQPNVINLSDPEITDHHERTPIEEGFDASTNFKLMTLGTAYRRRQSLCKYQHSSLVISCHSHAKVHFVEFSTQDSSVIIGQFGDADIY